MTSRPCTHVALHCRGELKKLYYSSTYHFMTDRKEALRRWKSKLGFKATYGKLLESFEQAGHTQCAEALCQVLMMKCGS